MIGITHPKPCRTCGEGVRIRSSSYCRACYNAYHARYRALQRHGPTLEGYKPVRYRVQEAEPQPVRLRGAPAGWPQRGTG